MTSEPKKKKNLSIPRFRFHVVKPRPTEIQSVVFIGHANL